MRAYNNYPVRRYFYLLLCKNTQLTGKNIYTNLNIQYEYVADNAGVLTIGDDDGKNMQYVF